MKKVLALALFLFAANAAAGEYEIPNPCPGKVRFAYGPTEDALLVQCLISGDDPHRVYETRLRIVDRNCAPKTWIIFFDSLVFCSKYGKAGVPE